tara:strand:+ start:2439 stop:3692 length:1254 start_codon:yes stop_codon:yes gene_type:complete
MNSSKIFLIISVCGGVLIGVLLGVYIIAPKTTIPIAMTETADTPVEPLYWVAPMDPDFRRPGPGLSPMGMDLIPVYPDNSGAKNSPGTVTISPDVINNLGVRITKARHEKFTRTILAPATIQFNEDHLHRVQPRIAGWVDKLYASTEGAKVTAGQPLYKLYSPTLVTAQEEFLLALKRNNKALIDGAEQRLRSLQIGSSIIQEIKQSGVIQHSIIIPAPRSGVISELNVREGDYVTPGKAIATIAALDSMWAIVEVIGEQSSTIKIGDQASVSVDGIPNRQWPASVDYIYPTLDKLNRSLQLRLILDNSEQILKPNMLAKTRFQQEASSKSVIIPSEALIRSRNQDRVVIALGEGRFKAIAVSVGRLNSSKAEILEGVETDDDVVISAQFLLDSESSKTSDFIRMNHDNLPSTGAAP